jgi:hypothetical protein
VILIVRSEDHIERRAESRSLERFRDGPLLATEEDATLLRFIRRSNHLEASMSRKGNWDNAVTESFFSALKKRTHQKYI